MDGEQNGTQAQDMQQQEQQQQAARAVLEDHGGDVD